MSGVFSRKGCPACGGTYDAAMMALMHKTGCPMYPGSGPAPLDKAPTPVASLDAARFNKASHPAHLDPRTALVAALEWYDAQPADERPQHIQIITGRDVGDEGCSGTRFFQAGSYRHHGQMGLCLEAMHMIRESGRD